MADQKKPIQIISSAPAVAVDGHGIGINPENGNVSLIFFQSVGESEDKKNNQVSVVSSVRLTPEQLERLLKDSREALDKRKKEKTKSE